MRKPCESLENYHRRKLKEAIEYLYSDKAAKEGLVRIANMEQEIGSYIACCSGMLLQYVNPLTEYDITSVLVALKGNLNFEDKGQENTKPCKYDNSEVVNVYKLDWKGDL